MKKHILSVILLALAVLTAHAEQPLRRPIDARHPLWLIHIDVWNAADPQKIINLIPEDIKPYVCMNLSLSCQYDKDKNLYKMPQQAVRTYKSWATVCQANGLWFTCQPASGGHTHIQDSDIETFEYFFRRFPNFLGWNYAEQFWGFDEQASDKSSSTQTSRWALFAKLVEMSHEYGGMLTISFCGNIWSHGLNPIGEMKRNANFLKACRKYPENILWLYKYTTSSCFYNNESVTFGPFVAGLATNYGVRYDNCGWNGATSSLLGDDAKKEKQIGKYPSAAGIATVMEQTAVNGGAVWDGPELIWTEDFKETDRTNVDGYSRRNWTTFEGFRAVWVDMFRKILDGTIYIPTREEVVGKTQIAIIADVTSGNDEQKYAAWGSLYDGLYKQDDPFNRGNGQWMDNYCYFKSTGRYGTIPVCPEMNDELAKAIPLRVRKSSYASRWSTLQKKVNDFDSRYPEVSKGDLYVNRHRNQLVTYTPYTYLNARRQASAIVPLCYNTCDSIGITLGMLGSALVREYADHIDLYLNNFRTDTTTLVAETFAIHGATAEPTYTITKRTLARANATTAWDEQTHTFTLTVRHLGGIDVRIDCSGAATDRNTDPLPSEPLAQDLPVQPAPYHGEIQIEAEDMDSKSVKSLTTSPFYSHPDMRGHAGNGFVEMGTNAAAALRHKLDISEAGDYRISVRYTSPTKAGRLRAAINGKSSTLTIEKTANNEWRKVTFDATLKAGSNVLIITNYAGTPLFIDQVIYTPVDVEPEMFDIAVRKVSYGSVTPDVTEAAEGQVVTLTIEANSGYGLKTLKVVNGVNFTLATTISLETLADGNSRLTFTMPDDRVTLQPVFAKGVNVVDGIELVEADGEAVTVRPREAAAQAFDLSGRPVSTAHHGIQIRNGRKTVIRR